MNRSTMHVLIVDRSAETREVLRTILARDGVRTAEASSEDTGLRLTRRLSPKVLVLDTDTIDLDDPSVCSDFGDEIRRKKCSVVLLGTVHRPEPRILQSTAVAKPYHFGPLLRRIEELLQNEH